MDDVNQLTEEDVRSMVRLLGDTVAGEGDHAIKKRFLVDGLCRLIDADCWIWALGNRIEPGQAQVYFNMLHSGFDEERFATFLQAIEHPAMGPAVERFHRRIQSEDVLVTMLRHEMDPEGLVDREGPAELWKQADIGSLMMCGYPIDAESMSGIAMYRGFDAPRFTQREKRIAHIIFEEVPWLHMQGWPEDRGVTVPKLYPRQRTVLNLLLDGLGRKQIAGHMGISENTVSGYTKDVYQHFGVSSHAELMHRFLAAGRSEV